MNFKFSGKRAAVGYDDGSVKVFDMKTATMLHHIPQGQAHTGIITDMDCHPDNNLLISSSVDGHAVMLKTQTGKVGRPVCLLLNFDNW
jgi:WD40 repeat protein